MRILFACLLMVGFFSGCMDLQLGDSFSGVPSGGWKGTFVLGDEDQVPIMFEVLNTDNEEPVEIYFVSGQSKTKADSVRVWGDSLFIHFNNYKSELKLKYEVDQMEGFLFNAAQKHYPIKFYGQFAMINRFPDVRKEPIANITGTWRVEGNSAQDSLVQGRLRLATKGNYAEGQLLLSNGLDIVLEGAIQGDKLSLSGFDGESVVLMNAQIASPEVLVQGLILHNDERLFWTAQSIAGVQQN